jgi:general secretion pathway protein B
MSYILDALKKAERERHLTKVPTVNTVHRISWDRRRPVWLWIAVAAVLANVAVLIWILRPEPPREKGMASTGVPAASTPIAPTVPQAPGVPADRPIVASQPDKATVTETAPPSEPPSTPRPAVSPHAPVAQRPSVAQQPPRLEATPEPAPKRVEAKRAPSVPVAPPAPSREPTRTKTGLAPIAPPGAVPEQSGVPPAPSRAVAATPEKPAAPPASASISAKPAERSAGPLPTLQDMTAAEQEAMPKLSLQVLVYSEVPAERMVFINNQKYVEGQSIEGKVAVESIVPDGAILSYQGKRFKLHH